MHESGRLLWIRHGKNNTESYIILKPTSLIELLRPIFRHDLVSIKAIDDVSVKLNGLGTAKFERMRNEVFHKGVLDREYLKCFHAWNSIFASMESEKQVYEFLDLILNEFDLGYLMPKGASLDDSSPSLDVSNKLLDTRNQSSDPDSKTRTRYLICCLRNIPIPQKFELDYSLVSLDDHRSSVTAVFFFPRHYPSGLFESLVIEAVQRNSLTPIFHWGNGFYGEHKQTRFKVLLQLYKQQPEIEITGSSDSMNCIRVEMVFPLPGRTIQDLWNWLFPFLTRVDDVLSRYAGTDIFQPDAAFQGN